MVSTCAVIFSVLTMFSPANAEEITTREENKSSFDNDIIFQNIEFTCPTYYIQLYGGAIYMTDGSSLSFDGDTTFQGNYVQKADVRQNNSIYADSSTINITADSGKTFTDYDGMDGKGYSVKNTGAANIKLFGARGDCR